MILYVAKHDSVEGPGQYFASEEFPQANRNLVEVVMVENFPEDIWAFTLAGGLPVDSDWSNDSTWVEWWNDGQTVYAR